MAFEASQHVFDVCLSVALGFYIADDFIGGGEGHFELADGLVLTCCLGRGEPPAGCCGLTLVPLLLLPRVCRSLVACWCSWFVVPLAEFVVLCCLLLFAPC